MERFFDRSDTQWRQLHECLHFYALPDPDSDLVERSVRTAGALEHLSGLGIQTPEHLHVTLQRLDAFEDDLHDERWTRLRSLAPSALGAQPAFDVHFDRPRPMSHAVEAAAEPGEAWTALIAAIRRLVVDVGLPATLTPSPSVPHYTIAYCTRRSDDGPVADALEGSGPTSMRISEVSLVSVTQEPERGRFSFAVLERWPLGDRITAHKA